MSEEQTYREIAGHKFDLRGVCVTNGCALPHKRLAEILSATKDDIGQPGWAHYGALNEKELGEIICERDRIYAAHKG